MDFAKTSNLRERDQHLINHWYIAALSWEVDDEPVASTLYDQKLVLFRDQNKKITCLRDRCLHRGAPLSAGEIRNGKLSCPYHGWEYDGDGNVVHVPSEGPDCQSKFRSEPLPCVEQDGAIWVWMGEGAPATETPPWRFPLLGEKGWYSYVMITEFSNEVTHLAENFMDVPHTVYVHHGWFRDEKLERKPVPMTVETKNGRVLVTYQQEKDELSFVAKMILNPKSKPMKHTDEFIFPNLTRVDYWFGDNGFIINSQISPVSSFKSRVYTYIAYRIPPILGWLANPLIRFYTRRVIEQDVWIMEQQSKNLKLEENSSFRSTPADQVHLSIERLRLMGMRGDPELCKVESFKEVKFWL